MQVGIASTYYARHEGSISSVDRRFARALEARGADVVHVDPLAVRYEIASGHTAMSYDGAPLRLDGLLVRRSAHHWNAVKTLVLTAHAGGTACVDRHDAFLTTYSGKFQAQLRRFRDPGVQTPRSWLYYNAASLAADPPPSEAYPLLRKPVRGSLGAGIHVLASAKELRTYVDTYDFSAPLMLQHMVTGVEYRALVLGDSCLGVVRKEPGDEGLGNVARGARFVPANTAELGPVRDLSLALVASYPYDFAAVDLIRDADGAQWVLECNRNPHFAGFEQALPDVDVASAVADFLLERVRQRRR